MIESVFELYIDLRTKIHKRRVVLLRVHNNIPQTVKPLWCTFPQSGHDLPSDFFVKRTALPKSFLQYFELKFDFVFD